MSTYNERYFREFFERNFLYIEGFMRNVRRYGDRPALVDVESDRSWNYRELNAEANRFARTLLASNLKPGDVVTYQLMNCPEFAFIYLGCQKIGVINNPINYRLSSGETAYILEDSLSRVYIFDVSIRETAEEALKLSKHKPDVVVVVGEGEAGSGVIPYREFISGASDENPEDPFRFGRGAFSETTRLYTSGTTGKPKGVPLNNINEILTAHDVIMHLHLTVDDVLLNISPWFHRGGIHIGGPGPAFYLGASIVALKFFHPRTTLEAISKYGVTYVVGVPTMYKLMLEEQKKRGLDLSKLRGVVSMGAPLDRSLCIEMQEVFTPNIFNGYGTSETFWNTLLLPGDLPDRAGKAGRACVDDEIRVVRVYEDKLADPDDTVAQDEEEVGEVIVKTFKSLYDYYKKPEELKMKVFKDWFYTGDLAVWDRNQYITIVSRKDDMIIVGGENIYPIQIEEAIQEHPKVMSCAVIGIPDRQRGQALAAYVVKKDESLTIEELREFIKGHPMIPPYKRPRYYCFVEQLPMTATGKKQHYKLREQALKDLEEGRLVRF
ncbi:class I adenylate-forming enzyme family protein [Thermodesulforhabdus norvegica]|uniref:Acyl-CoA synthetase (AMP-forming)/AMP-acid ligase II n=1 Tax=Thermodesulforhabdus norvegica TaxID=39841 RepID=A0A1I4V9Y6_9BACT|nr:AMP-binding protein [Thermodesulforhabdus norvegica]SFM98008.1 Acyl-CoA synthetase (AMP-forming)/AMP-acid ligase II [Thermodesulforhabdus norvegica]